MPSPDTKKVLKSLRPYKKRSVTDEVLAIRGKMLVPYGTLRNGTTYPIIEVGVDYYLVKSHGHSTYVPKSFMEIA